jgi:hypothetical protein
MLAYSMQKGDSLPDNDTLEALLILLPSNEMLQSLAKYEHLPQAIKTYFEKAIGTEPFDIVKVSMPILEVLRK